MAGKLVIAVTCLCCVFIPIGGVIQYSVFEEQGPDKPIGNIVTDSGLSNDYSPDEIVNFEFSFLSDPDENPRKSYFRIHETSGLLLVKKQLDKEEMCPFENSCSVVLTIAVGPALYFRVISVNVTVLDINDHNPIFAQNQMDLFISEEAVVDTTYSIPTATDADYGVYGVQRYVLLPETHEFGLQTKPTIDGSEELFLVIKNALDREETAKYRLEVLAYDGGDPPQSAAMVLNITIGDYNDNSPKFTQDEYSVDIEENIAVPVTVVTVEAVDPDLSAAGHVSYGFSSLTFAKYGHMFNISARTGEIVLTKKLDYETVNQYSLTVTARDSDTSSRSAFVSVIVNVVDYNDFAPQIAINTLTANGEAQINEDSAIGTFVSHISVVDKDSSLNGLVTCTLDDDNFALQKIQDTQYKIVTSKSLNREEKQYYSVKLDCHDNGSPSLRTTKFVNITVLDVNDNKPTFSRQKYTVAMAENNLLDAKITEVSATDKDMGAAGQVRYGILEDEYRDMFHIDRNTGVIRAISVLDYEKSPELRFHVTATDRGDPPLSATALVEVALIDLNDEAPIFGMKEGYTFVVKENQPRGLNVGHVMATDADSEPFNSVEYSFQDTSDALSFQLHPLTGQITTTKQLDREVQSVYHLKVTASNSGYSHLHNTVKVDVYVDDENDNEPVFMFPNEINNHAVVYAESSTGEVITQVRAVDTDIGENARISYAIVATHFIDPESSKIVEEENENSPFDIDTNLGAIILDTKFSELKHDAYNLTVVATDGGKPAMVAVSRLLITVNRTYGLYYPHGHPDSHSSSGPNMVIVICLVSISGVLMILLLCAIVWVVYRSRGGCGRSTSSSAKYRYQGQGPCERGVGEARCEDISAPLDRLDYYNHGTPDYNPVSTMQNKPSDKKPTNEPQGHNSADSGFEDHAETLANQSGKHVTFAKSPPHVQLRLRPGGKMEYQPNIRHQEADRESTSSNEGSNTDSGCVCGEEKEDGEHHDTSAHGGRLREIPPPPPPPKTSVLSMRDNSILYNPHCVPPKQTVRDVKSKDKQKKREFISDKMLGDVPVMSFSTFRSPQNTDSVTREPKVDPGHPQIPAHFKDSNSLLRYKVESDRNRCSSEMTDNTSSTSGSYVINPDEAQFGRLDLRQNLSEHCEA